MGRPLKGDSKRDKRIEFRVSESEVELINSTAERSGMTRGDMVIKAVKEFADRLE